MPKSNCRISLALALAAALGFGVVACGGDDNTVASTGPATTPPVTTQPPTGQDGFFSAVGALALLSGDDSEARDIDAFSATVPEDTDALSVGS